MKKSLLSTVRWFLVALLALTSVQASRATHIQGGQISYRYVGPGTAAGTDRYSVTVSFFRDCTGQALPTSLSLTARRATCTATATTATLSVAGPAITGQPYCAATQALAACTATSPFPLYEYRDFTGNIDLAPATEWILGVDDCCRPNTANLVGQGAFRFEARLYSLNGTTPLRNTSPQYSPLDLPVPFVPVNLQSSVSFAANEPDGDSLVYQLEAPLQTCGVFSTFKTIPGTCAPVAPVVPGCTFVCPPTGPGRLFSGQMPIAVGYTNTLCSGGTYTLTPKLVFTSQTGLLTFTPNRFVATTPIMGDNKYAVACKILEYRRLVGSNRRVLIGSVRRDFLVTVVNGSGNQAPNPPMTVLDSTSVGSTAINTVLRTRLEVSSCNFSQARVTFTDPDNLTTPPPAVFQNLTVTYTGAVPVATAMQNLGTATLANNGSPTPVLTLTFQPTPLLVGRTITLTYRADDNACPIKGTQTRVIEIFVRDGRKVRAQAQTASVGLNNTGAGTALPVTICPGGAVNLTGLVTAIDSVRQLVAGRVTKVAQTYDLVWFAPSGAGLPPVSTATNTRSFNITVRPTVTTRYTLFSNPRTGGFPLDPRGLNVCGDSVSVLVKVAPEPVLRIAASDSAVCAGTAVTLTGSASRTDGIADTYTYLWSGTGVTGNTNAQVSVAPLVTTTYTLTAAGDPRFGCDAMRTFTVRVIPAPVVAIAASDTVVCAGAPVTLTGSATRSDGVVDTYTYAWAGGTATGSSTAQITVTPQVTTRYTLTVNGSPQLGCQAAKSISIRVVAAAVARFATTDSVSIASGSGGRLLPPVTFTFTNQSALSNGTRLAPTDTVRYTYQRVRTFSGEPVTSPEVVFARGVNALTTTKLTRTETGYYIIRLYTATSAAGRQCSVSSFARTIVVPDFQIPNIITPNGDGLNDKFVIVGGLLGSRLEIYNRWGRKVSEFANYQNQWDGEGQSDGVYYYYLTETSGTKTKGWVEVRRDGK